MRTEIRDAAHDARFAHDALFYSGDADFVDRVGAFVVDAVAAREPVLVAVSVEKIERLRRELGGDPDGVRFADMAQLGHNPARIIPAWREFVDEQTPSGRRFRGVGEPIWTARSPSEVVECERHEALLNLAFADAPAWWVLCPYDTGSLPVPVLDGAKRNHPHLLDGTARRESGAYRGLHDASRPFDDPLPQPGGVVHEHPFGPDAQTLSAIRLRVGEATAAFGLGPSRSGDVILSVNEVVTNSVRHGGGAGVLRIWEEDSSLICEVADAGHIDDPLAGRGRPPADGGSGFGLWLANQLCDLVQIRSFATGSVVRLHVRR